MELWPAELKGGSEVGSYGRIYAFVIAPANLFYNIMLVLTRYNWTTRFYWREGAILQYDPASRRGGPPSARGPLPASTGTHLLSLFLFPSFFVRGL